MTVQEQLIKRFYEYIRAHYPDILIRLQEQAKVTDYLNEQISAVESTLASLQQAKLAAYEVEAACFNELVEALGPSKYNYVADVLETEYYEKFDTLSNNGLLVHEVINMMALCEPVFEQISIPADPNAEDRLLYNAIAGVIAEYLESK